MSTEQGAAMQIGVVYPQNELGGDPQHARRFATTAEELGFAHLLAYDHVLGAEHHDRVRALQGSYTETDPFHDPLVLFSHLAAITTHLEFATGVLILPQRQTALVARQAADVDLFSSGRLRLGVGVGWNHVEYEALDQDFRTRGAREEEQIEVLRTLFTETLVDYTGRFHRIDRATLLPKPTRSLPLWLGGSGDKAHDRAARLADGFIFIASDVDHATDAWGHVQDRLDVHSRPVDGFGADYVAAPQHDVDVLAKETDTWRKAGGSHLSVRTVGLGLDTLDAHLDYLTAAATALGL